MSMIQLFDVLRLRDFWGSLSTSQPLDTELHEDLGALMETPVLTGERVPLGDGDLALR